MATSCSSNTVGMMLGMLLLGAGGTALCFLLLLGTLLLGAGGTALCFLLLLGTLLPLLLPLPLLLLLL